MQSSTETNRQGEATTASGRLRLPPWLRIKLPKGQQHATFNKTRSSIETGALHTVCEEARCPNVHDCWSRGTATFMIAGKSCTRGCRFCSVETLRTPPPPEEAEPARLAEAVAAMSIEHVVITVVNRDDLEDGGALHYRACIDAVHARSPETTIELLSSDLAGNMKALELLLENAPLDVFAHNVECVPRLDRIVRDTRASFEQSLEILKTAKELRPDIQTKSSLMVGLGERDDEVVDAMQLLRKNYVDIITLGQYLAPGLPGERYLPIDRFVTPEQFDRWASEAKELGFAAVASGPLVRSSYRAGHLFEEATTKRDVPVC